VGYQGRLTDASGSPINGSKTITLKLFTALSGGSPVYTETQSVNVTNGLFNLALGSSVANNQYGLEGVDPEVFAQPLWLQMEMDGLTFTPRQKLLGAPYALSLAGGAVVGGTHEGNGAGGSDTTDANYGSLTVAGGSTGTAFVIGSLGGDLIRGCSGLVSGRTCGDLEFRVDANGNVRADGTYTAGGADVAELFRAVAGAEAGDVLAIGPDGHVVRSSEAFQRTVVGVFSTEPGYIANGALADEVGSAPVALMGVVPVKVTAANGAIAPGDLLVASPVPGYAMRGGDNPPQGTVIGKALEALANGRGVIQMLVMLR
jgi:hypothetical protein